MSDTKESEMDDITLAMNQLGIKATPNTRRSKRIRHKKAKEIVENKNKLIIEEIEEEEEGEEEKEKEETKQQRNIDKNMDCIVFPSFNNINYMQIIDKYEIEIPNYLKKWLIKVLRMINNADINNEIDGFEWMVLIHPSLILIKESISDKILINLANKTIEKMKKFMLNEAKLCQLSLNDILLCIELNGYNELNEIPEFVWNQLNEYLESATTLNKFLEITCSKTKEIKMVKELLNCTTSKIKNNYSKVRDKWMTLITPYTQICRINRLFKTQKYNKYLTVKSKENINILCHIFDDKYNMILRELIISLKERSDSVKQDYAYWRYKIMAMCTHTNSTIIPTFAGYIGYIHNNNYIDIQSLKCLIDGLYDDINLFIKTINNIISEMNKKKIIINIKNINKKIPKKQLNNLRILDHICYNSICAQLMFESFSKINKNKDKTIKIYYDKLKEIRNKMRLILDKLAENSLLFPVEIKTLKDDILEPSFLIYEKEGKQCWMVHLMSGVLFNYWLTK